MNDKTKKAKVIVFVAVLSFAVLVGVVLAIIFGLQAYWKSEVIKDIRIPTYDNGFTLTVRRNGISGSQKSSSEFTLKYNPERKGLWLHMSGNSEYIFAYDDTCYLVDKDFDPAYCVLEKFSAEELKFRLENNQLGFVDYYIWNDVCDMIFGNREEVVERVWKQGDEYLLTLDGEYLFAKGFDGLYLDENAGLSIGDFDCRITASDKTLRSFALDFEYSKYNSLFIGMPRIDVERSIGIEINDNADFSDVELPDSFKLSQQQRKGELFKSLTEFSDEYAGIAYTTPDEALKIFARESADIWDDEVALFAEEGILAVIRPFGFELFCFPEMNKLADFEYYADIAGIDIYEGKLAVLVSGSPSSGSGLIDAQVPDVSVVYLYDLSDFENTVRYVISDCTEGEISDMAYDGKYVYFDDGSVKKLDVYTGEITACDDMPPSSSAVVGDGFVEYTPQAGEGYVYKTPVGFSFTNYTGYSFEGYDVVTLMYPDAFGLYYRTDGRFDCIFPDAAPFGGGEQFVYEFGDGEYICFLNNALFTVDMNGLCSHRYWQE